MTDHLPDVHKLTNGRLAELIEDRQLFVTFLESGNHPDLENALSIARDIVAALKQLAKPAHEREPPHCKNCSCGMPAEPSDEIRALFNKAVGFQDGTRIRFGFETVEEANKAFDYIGELGSMPSETTEACPACGGTKLTNGRPCEVCSPLRKVPA